MLHGMIPDGRGDNGAWGRSDNDGLNNRAEFLAGTDPKNFDSNGDGLQRL